MTGGPAPGAAPNTTSYRDAPQDWRHQAACLTEDPELFFPADAERSGARKLREALARSVCATCPVADACFLDAIRAGERIGIRGGQDMSTVGARIRRQALKRQDAA